MRARPLYAGILAFLPCLCAQGLEAQSVRGTVQDSVTGLPIRGAFVELLDTAWARRAGVLADSAGAFRLAPPLGGSYLLRAEAIGYADGRVLSLTVRSGEDAVMALRLSPNPVPLAELKVPAIARCNLRSDSSSGLLAVWAEARKALAVADWSARESGLVMVTSTEQRYPDRDMPRTPHIDTVSGRAPYTTLPSDSAFRHGLVQRLDAAYVFYGPGPEYIMSDRFLESHCFAVRKGRGRVGLTFVPAARKPRRDIRGTLWLDRTTSALQELEFEYVGLTDTGSVDRATGQMRFARVPGDFLVIRRWTVRLRMHTGSGASVLTETSGAVLDTWLAPGRVTPEAP